MHARVDSSMAAHLEDSHWNREEPDFRVRAMGTRWEIECTECGTLDYVPRPIPPVHEYVSDR